MAEVRYQNFDLTVQRDGEDYRVRIESASGQASGRFAVPFSDIELENFILTTTPGRRGVRRVDTPDVAAAKRFGERLFTSIFTGDVLGRLMSALNDVSHSEERLRLRLRLTEVPELADLPWEYLYNAPVNRFLALDEDTALVRYLDLPERVRPVKVQFPLRVLVVISNPNDYARLDVEREWENLKEALGELEQAGLVVLDLLEDATMPALRKQLAKAEYNIFHFIGHGVFDRQGEEGVVVLKDENGRGRFVSGQQLGWLMHNHKSLALAVLNACEGARGDRADAFTGTAQNLVQQGIPAVVAMQREITDDAAKTFAHAFYTSIAAGRPVESSLTETRLAIFAEGHGLEWATPVLYMRSQDGRIFDLQAALDGIQSSKLKLQHSEAPVPDPEEKKVAVTQVVPASEESVKEARIVPVVDDKESDTASDMRASGEQLGSNLIKKVNQNTGEMLRTLTDGMTPQVDDLLSDTFKKARDQSAPLPQPRPTPKKEEQQASSGNYNLAIMGLVAVAVLAVIWYFASQNNSTQGNNNSTPTAGVSDVLAPAQATQTAEAALGLLTPDAFVFDKELARPADVPAGSSVAGVEISDDDSLMAVWYQIVEQSQIQTASTEGKIAIWSVLSPDILTEFQASGPAPERSLMAFFPGKFELLDTRDFLFLSNGRVTLRNIADPQVSRLIGNDDVLSMAIRHDGQSILTGSREGSVSLWWPLPGIEKAALTGHTGDVIDVAISPFSAWMATTELNETRIWDGTNDQYQYTISHSLGGVDGRRLVKFSHDNQTIAICSSGGCGFWKLSTGELIGTLDSGAINWGGLGPMLAAGFSADDQTFATSWPNGTIHFWKDGQLSHTFKVDTGETTLSAMAFSWNLTDMVIASDDGRVQIWRAKQPAKQP